MIKPTIDIEELLKTLAVHFLGKNEGFLQCVHEIENHFHTLRKDVVAMGKALEEIKHGRNHKMEGKHKDIMLTYSHTVTEARAIAQEILIQLSPEAKALINQSDDE